MKAGDDMLEDTVEQLDQQADHKGQAMTTTKVIFCFFNKYNFFIPGYPAQEDGPPL